MTITICSSMSFFQNIVDIEKELKNRGYKVFIPHSTHKFFEKPGYMFNDDFDYCERNDVMMDHYKKIEKSDAILVINNKKNKIKNYIGGSVLGEMAISYYLGKKIFLLNGIPSEDDIRYAFEIKSMKPIIINNDLNKIK